MSLTTDEDPVIICPYDRNHRIARSRIQRHLVKCEKNFPPNFKKQCPYDASHRVYEQELVNHVKNCPMKYLTSADIGQIEKVPLPKETVYNGNDEEVWDEDGSLNSSNDDKKLDFEYSTIENSDTVGMRQQNNQFDCPDSNSVEWETSSLSSDVDSYSGKSNIGRGRGRGFLQNYAGPNQYSEVNSSCMKGIRGRLRPLKR